jgi:DNA-binding MarR family transcriptional regulator
MSKTDDSLSTLPPSAKLVLKVLEYNEDLTQSKIADKSRLPQRTVRYALDQLESEGFVRKRVFLEDTRQHLYSMATDVPSIQPESKSEE